MTLDTEQLQHALFAAVSTNRLSSARSLLAAGADATDGKLLHLAATSGFDDMCTLLLDNGVEVDVARRPDGYTPLMSAAFACHPSTCRLLLERGADVNITHSARTPLHSAAGYATQGTRERAIATCRILIEAGAKIDATDAIGQTALHLAINNDDLEISRMLVESGANVRTGPGIGTALRLAMQSRHLDICLLIVDRLMMDNENIERSSFQTDLLDQANLTNDWHTYAGIRAASADPQKPLSPPDQGKCSVYHAWLRRTYPLEILVLYDVPARLIEKVAMKSPVHIVEKVL